jgi:plasmid maintenance system antidote protein VapI
LLADPNFWKRRGGSIASEEDFMRPYTRHKQSSRIQDIANALIASGYKALDEQAKALGIHRATAWTIIKNKHKLGRLSAKTIQRILSNSETPQAVLEVIRKYTAERSTADRRADTRKQKRAIAHFRLIDRNKSEGKQ